MNIYAKVSARHILCVLSIFFSLFLSSAVSAKVMNDFPRVSEVRDARSFQLSDKGKTASIWVDESDYKVVHLTAQMFVDDVYRVCQVKPQLHSVSRLSDVPDRNIVLIGTIGKSRLIDNLISKRKIDVSGIKDKWESFVVETVEKPFKGVDRALVIAGWD